jgi:ketosteroid isomerase-like protein
MKRKQTKEIAEAFIDALHSLEDGNANNVEQMIELFADDARLTNAALRGRELSGTEGIRQFWTEYRQTFGAVHSEFSHVLVDEEAAGLFWRTQGTHRDGQPIDYHGVSLLELSEDGRIRFFRGYYDTGELGREVGIDQQAQEQARG